MSVKTGDATDAFLCRWLVPLCARNRIFLSPHEDLKTLSELSQNFGACRWVGTFLRHSSKQSRHSSETVSDCYCFCAAWAFIEVGIGLAILLYKNNESWESVMKIEIPFLASLLLIGAGI